MPISSMTGFARAEGASNGISWVWELRSVNGRGLEIRCKVPAGFDGFESAARQKLSAGFKRGSISASLTVQRGERGGDMRLNPLALQRVLDIVKANEGAPVAPPRWDGLLALRGVIEFVEEDSEADHEARDGAIDATLNQAVARLADARAAEGKRLAPNLAGQLAEIAALQGEAVAQARAQEAFVAQRFKQRIAELMDEIPTLPEDRLAQEIALLIAKSDIREELDRLAAHVGAALELLASEETVGRRLDFLCQEFAREANTVCSKSATLDLTRVGLQLKAVIEQFREQVQNIE